MEVYDVAFREWIIIPDHSLPIKLLAGQEEVLLSLRPNWLKQFHSKPGFRELCLRLPHRGGMPEWTTLKNFVSPPRERLSRGSSTTPLFLLPKVPTNLGGDGHYSPPLPASPRPSPVPLPPLTIHPHTSRPSSPSTVVREKTRRFPSGFLARDVLSKVSQYLIEREGNHGKFLEILRRICHPHPVCKSTAASLAKAYRYNHTHFVSLDRNLQLTITWSELDRLARAANTPPATVFVSFIDPTRLPVSTSHTAPVVSTPPTGIINLSSGVPDTPVDPTPKT